MSEPARARRSVAVAAGLLLLTMAAVLVVSTRHGLTSVGRASSAPAEPASALRALVPFKVFYRDLLRTHPELVRTLRFTYVANGGRHRAAFLVLPRWYDRHRHPPIPLVIAPHGRGISARDNLRFWGALPAFGPFALVDPVGQGRRLTRYSWGWRGQIDDLARMPRLVEQAVPGLRIDLSRIYAIGSSMGGQETLLLVARHPQLLAGAAALDSDTDMAVRYYAFPALRDGARLQALARQEIGGTPTSAPRAYELRSPVYWARAIAKSGVPLHIWWSTQDRIVRDQVAESGRLFRLIRAFRPRAPVSQYVGTWAHSHEFRASARLPLALLELGLIRLRERIPRPDQITREPGHPG